ncbi:Hpt domain-containing protein [Desulfotruncus alcoholivorax]|uniref:Hpt domain-containing protein n=1 Tax=Desulfotruncus alcoholivorax TaxID=265477 RepID=UPI0003FA4898|nr:Hpt domain-containing protein [Desulfotruncus alcoholivorax]
MPDEYIYIAPPEPRRSDQVVPLAVRRLKKEMSDRMVYKVPDAAADIMVDPEDLKEVYEIYFDESRKNLSACCAALAKGDWKGVAKLAHAVKGASSNLRIHSIRYLAELLELHAKSGKTEAISVLLLALCKEFDTVRTEVQRYFHTAKF